MDARLMPIFKRRSVRKFTGAPVTAADVTALLEAGMSAANARNLRPWHFVVVADKARLVELATIHPYGPMLAEAGAAIAVCGDLNVSPDFWVHDCAASTENILVAAAMLGLGSVWLGVWPRADREESVGKYLGVPQNARIMSLVAIGHPAEEPTPRTQYDKTRVHAERW